MLTKVNDVVSLNKVNDDECGDIVVLEINASEDGSYYNISDDGKLQVRFTFKTMVKIAFQVMKMNLITAHEEEDMQLDMLKQVEEEMKNEVLV